MIIELDINDINILNNTFINLEYIEKELSLNPYGKVLLLQEDDNIIGYLYYSDIYERAEINQIEVEESYRNKKNASKLMEYLIKKVNKDISLEVREDNIYALKLYEKYGFKKVAIRKGYYNGIDGLLMERNKDSI